MQNRQLLYVNRPKGVLGEDSFASVTGEVVRPGTGEVLCRTILLSIDPANRAWMQARTYREQLAEGTVMAGHGIAEVIASESEVPVGAIVAGPVGWQEYAVLAADEVEQIDVRSELTHYLGVLGITGLTAYFGLLDVGRPTRGDTVLVSGAAGATGNVVGQLATIHGCRPVGIVGSAEKADFLTGTLGFAAAVNYRSPEFGDELRQACPDGVDVFFDNVGGPTLERALRLMNPHGRIANCGAVSQYDTDTPGAGPSGVPGLVITKRLRMQGFIVHDFQDRWDDALRELEGWIASGDLTVVEDVLDDLDSAPAALIGLLEGQNTGKRMVRVSAD
ncbi:MAG: NADP-dependent oxidoreductase [Bacillota bacterium]|nr:NADP-dependent oxidoreductase [Bacillota bacterium]